MKTLLITTILLAGIFIQADDKHPLEPVHPLNNGATYKPALFLNLPDDMNRTLDVMNMLGSSTAYAIAANGIRNNSGTGAHTGAVQPEPYSEQFLRILSSFDLYTTRKIKEFEFNFKNSVKLKYVGTSVPASDISPSSMAEDLSDKNLKTAFNLLAPFFDNNIRKAPESLTCSQDFITKARSGLQQMILNRFPNSPAQGSSVQRLNWLGISYQPLLVQGDITIDAKKFASNSILRNQVYFPSLGRLVTTQNGQKLSPADWTIAPIDEDLTINHQEIDSQYIKFDRLSYRVYKSTHGNNLGLIKLETEKQSTLPDQLKLRVSLGNLDLNAQKDCDVAPLTFDDPEDGIVLRGKTKKGDIDVRLSIHKLAFNLKRKSFKTWKEAFDNDAPFDEINSIPSESVMSITFYKKIASSSLESQNRLVRYGTAAAKTLVGIVDPFTMLPIGDATVMGLQWLSGVKCYNDNTGSKICYVTFASLSELRDSGFMKYLAVANMGLGKIVMSQVTKQAGASIDAQVPQALKQLDSAIATSMKEVLNQLMAARAQLTTAITKIY